MYKGILSKEQHDILPLIGEFSKDFYLVGGTAIALQLGHRHSIDFDLFTEKKLKRKQIINVIQKNGFIPDKIIYEAYDQMHLIIKGVKVTFFQYEHEIKASLNFENIINIPPLPDLAAMKAYALGGRAKWKDYVDLYFIIKNDFSYKEISNRAVELFQTFFNPKLFKEQLSYFDDIDYSEEVIYLPGQYVSEEEIKRFLIDVATEEF